MRRRWVVLVGVALALVMSGCSAGSVTPRSNRYVSGVDGVTAGWPRGWQRVERQLTSFTGAGVDLLVLATFDPPPTRDVGCAQDAPAAIDAMRAGDAFFRLRTVSHLVPDSPAGPRPSSFFAAARPIEHAGGCERRDVVSLHAWFEEDGRLYDAELRARAPLDDRRRHETETIWNSLGIDPIVTGEQSAEVGREYWHVLSTHCGITHTTFDGRDWVADPALAHGGAGPGSGWHNPSEVGTMRLENPRAAVFTSRDGKRSAHFRPRVGGGSVPACD